MSDRLLRAKQLEELTGIPAATWRWWAHIEAPDKPVSFKLGKRRRVWRESTVLAWIAEQEAQGGHAA
ncbi:helix-turn-helix transcriptional regulator [Nocardia sp. NPDC004123]